MDAQDLLQRWHAGDRDRVVDDIAYLDKRHAIITALEFSEHLDNEERAQFLRRLRVKFLDRG